MEMVPEMVIFDYGQTLADEGDYDAVRGNRAVLSMAVKNPRGITAEQLQEFADELTKDMEGLFGEEKRGKAGGEFSAVSFDRYLYEDGRKEYVPCKRRLNIYQVRSVLRPLFYRAN